MVWSQLNVMVMGARQTLKCHIDQWELYDRHLKKGEIRSDMAGAGVKHGEGSLGWEPAQEDFFPL